MSQLPTPLRGIIPPMVTPLKDRDALDVPGLERVVRHLLAGGVHGLFLLGSTGEGTSLGHRPRMRELHSMTMRVAEEVYRMGSHPSAIIKGVKCALTCLGLCNDFMAEPFQRFGEPERRRIEAALKAIEPEVGAALKTAAGQA